MEVRHKSFLGPIVLGIVIAAALWMAIQLVQTVIAVRSYEARPVTARGELAAFEQTAADVFANAAPSVAYIFTQKERSASGSARQEGAGSGFVWDQSGHIITNHHVIAGTTGVFVRFDSGNVMRASVVGSSPDHDLAVLRVSQPAAALKPLPLGSSSDLRVGQAAFAIGNPFGLARSLTTGIISALDRTLPTSSAREITGVIQTDAAINPGNSGGPLLDSAGRLIGVNTAIASGTGSYSGIGFAVPVDTVNRIVPQLIATGSPSRPGIGIRAASEEIAARFSVDGVVVVDVLPDGPAAKAGLRGIDVADGRLGDVITAVNGRNVRSLSQLAGELEQIGIGNTATLTVQRGSASVKLAVPIVDIR